MCELYVLLAFVRIQNGPNSYGKLINLHGKKGMAGFLNVTLMRLPSRWLGLIAVVGGIKKVVGVLAEGDDGIW